MREASAEENAGQNAGKNAGKNGCAMSFGPGLVAETMMFRMAG
jgi:predicted naringenin-chalcone synthase